LQVEVTDLRARLATAESALDDSLRVRERQALLILNEMYQFVAPLDVQGNELETNQTSLDAVGLRREDCIGRPFWEIPVWPDSIITDLQASFQHVITTGEFMRFEVEFFVPGKERELLTTDITLKPIRDAQHEVAFVVLEGRDITERKRAEAEVARKNAELQALYDQMRKLDQLKSMSFAMMNHDLRSPLTLILVPTESLLQEASLDQVVRRTLEMVARNARLLLNLLSNAFKFTPLGGNITCCLETEAASGEASEMPAQVVFIVQDSGPGVSVDLREVIFVPFRQAGDGTTRRLGGSGLGLAIVKDLVSLHGGTIRVDEAPDSGARFSVRLPQHAPAASRMQYDDDPDRSQPPRV
jgi:PAS domain S-box-containing protein